MSSLPAGLSFVKWEGLGNDFVVLQGPPPPALDCADWARQICDRHTGVGADGLAFLTPEPGMLIYNADGSLAQMCGNALRCLGAAAVQTGQLALDQDVNFQTTSGQRSVRVLRGDPWWVEVDMGAPQMGGEARFDFEGQQLIVHLCSMGNPHAVVLSPGLPPRERWEECGRLMQKAAFAAADGINVEFVTLSDPLQVWVYERGVGPTLACGTGACAAFAVALPDSASPGRVQLPGGELEIELRQGTLRMRGPAREVYRGHWTAN